MLGQRWVQCSECFSFLLDSNRKLKHSELESSRAPELNPYYYCYYYCYYSYVARRRRTRRSSSSGSSSSSSTSNQNCNTSSNSSSSSSNNSSSSMRTWPFGALELSSSKCFSSSYNLIRNCTILSPTAPELQTVTFLIESNEKLEHSEPGSSSAPTAQFLKENTDS